MINYLRTQEYWDIGTEEGIYSEATMTISDSPGKEVVRFFIECSDVWYIN